MLWTHSYAMKPIKSNTRSFVGRGLALAILGSAVTIGQPVALAQSRTVKSTMDARSAFATITETQLRQRGLDARVQLAGDARDVLRIDWQNAGRRDIYSFVNSAAMAGASARGFKSIVFTSGQQRWDYDLARESMVWNPAPVE
jgi:type II secretory pathway pseudopilin PulG